MFIDIFQFYPWIAFHHLKKEIIFTALRWRHIHLSLTVKFLDFLTVSIDPAQCAKVLRSIAFFSLLLNIFRASDLSTQFQVCFLPLARFFFSILFSTFGYWSRPKNNELRIQKRWQDFEPLMGVLLLLICSNHPCPHDDHKNVSLKEDEWSRKLISRTTLWE